MLNLFKKKDHVKPFWEWFLTNQSSLEHFIQSDQTDYSVYHQLTAELHKFSDLLFPEITTDENGNFILIITPDGIKKGVNPTIEIVESAPTIENWTIKKFRQPAEEVNLSFEGLEKGYNDIKILRQFDHRQEVVHIAICIDGYKEKDKRFISMAFLYLDHILGEFNVLTRVGQIEFRDWDILKEDVEAVDLIQLREEIAKELY